MFCDETGATVTPAPTAAQLTAKGVLTGRSATDATDVYVKAVATYLRNKTTATVESAPYQVTVYQKTYKVTLASLDEGGTPQDPPKTFINLEAGDSAMQLSADVSPASAMQGVTWSSSNPKIATVSQTGLVTPLALGTVTVTATSADGLKKSDPYGIYIGVPASGLSIAASATTLVSNAKCTLTATLAPVNATFKTVNWKSGNTGVATVSSTGVVTARSVTAASEVTVTATAADGSGATEAITLRVIPRSRGVTVKDSFGYPVTSNMLAYLNLNVSTLKSIAYTAACTPADALQTVTWSSSNPGVATVAGGVVTAVKNGTAVIKATAADGSCASLSFRFQVTCLPESVTVSGQDSVAVGKKVALKATVGPAYVSAQSVTWALAKASTGYASIDAAGVVTAKNVAANAGKTISVYATTQAAGASGRKITSAAFTLTLTSPTVSVMTNFGVGSVKASGYLYQKQLQLSSVCQPSAAAQNVVWSSGDTKIAKVDQTGMVTFVAAGKVNITVTAADGTGVKTVIALTLAN